MMRIYFTIFLTGTTMLLAGCASITSSSLSGTSLVDHLPATGRLSGSDAAADKSMEINFGIARVAERNDRVTQAVTAYHEILSKHPNHAPTLQRLGVISARQGRVDEALDYFSKAAEFEEPSAELLGDIGYAQYLADDYDSAAATLQKAALMSPNDERIINNLAIVLGMQRKYADSLELFRQTGSEAESLAGVAFTQSQTGQLDQAKSTYHRSLEMDPSLDIAANGLLELDRFSRSKETGRDSLSDTQVASYQHIRNVVPGGGLPAPKNMFANSSDSSDESPSVLKSLAGAIHERSGLSKRSKSEGKLAKPPVIALAALNRSNTTSAGRSKDSSQIGVAGAPVGSGDSVARSTARIVIADTVAVPIAEVPTGTNDQSFGTENLNREPFFGSSSRREFGPSNPIEPSQVQHVDYQESVDIEPRR